MTYPQWERLRASQQSFSGLAAWSEATFDLATRGKSRFAENALWVSGDFFNVLGVRPALGRVLTAADDVKGCGAPRVVLSHAFWLREFGGDRSVLAKSLAINGHRLDVVGVTEAGFFGVEVGRSFDFAVPLCADGLINGDANRLERRSSWWLGVMGRLKDGWSLAQADAHLASLSPALFRDTLPAGWSPQDTADYLGFKLGAFPGAAGVSRLRQEYDTPLALLLALAGIVLLIACANLANLLLARGGAREREMAVRLALGASRARLMRQLLTESLLLASIGAVLSGWIAYAFGLAMVQTISSPVSPLFVDLSTNWRLVAFTAALAVLTCILFGIMPALRAAGIAPGESMKGGSRQQAADAPRATLRRGLVAAEVALSLLLLVGGLLFARSLFNLLTLDAGFRQEGILEADVDLTRLDLPSAGLRVFRRELIDRVRAIPGVDAAASASSVPLVGNWWRTIYADAVERERLGSSRANRIGPGYFETMGIAVRAGRDFDDRDTPSSRIVAIVNDAFAKSFVKGAPLGSTIRFEGPNGRPDVVARIVALVSNTKHNSLREEFGPIVYLAESQQMQQGRFVQILIRSEVAMATLMPAVSRTLDGAHEHIAFHFHDFQEQIRYSLLRDRLMAVLCGFFAALAAVLATVGVYGVISYSVVRRTHEIGIRLALGAGRGDILRLELREAAAVLGAGLVLGTLLTWICTRMARDLLFGLQPDDPGTLATGVAFMAVVAAAAALVPARRAARVDPVVALRCD
jgi:predicted permease